MRVPVFQLDAFAERRFAGNPAAVVRMERFLDDDVLQAIAAGVKLGMADPSGGLCMWFV
jgi:predicted PhzF superfamily epimerase YddE/YHI9